jgi:uncharacterized spore protein YtfJ
MVGPQDPKEADMEVQDVIGQARDAITVKRVFGEPYEKNGVTLIPAAKVQGGAGGGTGEDATKGKGQGGGFGLTAKPVGAFVIRDGQVVWQPAVDVNRIAAIGGMVAVFFLFTVRSVARARARTRVARAVLKAKGKRVEPED